MLKQECGLSLPDSPLPFLHLYFVALIAAGAGEAFTCCRARHGAFTEWQALPP